MDGELVLLRTATGAAVAQVWKDKGSVVLIRAPGQDTLNAIKRGELYPIGFRRTDVFRFDPTVGVPEQPNWEEFAAY